jgi:hypothetical protein
MARNRVLLLCGSVLFSLLTACGGSGGNGGGGGQQTVTPTVTVTPALQNISTLQSLSVTVTVSGSAGTPTGTVAIKSGTFVSSAVGLSAGKANVNIPAGTLALGSDTLTASYTPDTSSSSIYNSASGSNTVAVSKAQPVVTATPSAQAITTLQSFSVSVTVSGGNGAPAATGSVQLTSGSYTSSAATLASGAATISVPAANAGGLTAGNDALTVTYTPDTSASATYATATGTNSITVNLVTPTVTATPSAASINGSQGLSVVVTVSGGAGAPTPTGSVTLTGGGYTSSATPLAGGTATINVAAGKLTSGNDTLTATYAPDPSSIGIYAGSSGAATVQVVGVITPTVTVTPANNSINTQQSLDVTVAVSGGNGNPTATGSVTLSSGTYSSGAQTLSSGSVIIDVPKASLAPGNDTLSASYTPDASSNSTYGPASGTAPVGVTRITPSVAVTPASNNINTSQSLQVTVAVNAPNGDAVPTGTVKLTGGGYTSSSTALSNGSASITIAAGQLATGSDTLSASYTADAASQNIYNSSNGTSAAITVTLLTAVSVNQAVSGPAVTDQLLGMNMAAWFDPTSSFVVPAFQKAGIKAMRWPGGSWSDEYHWNGNFMCQGTPPNLSPGGWAQPNAVYTSVISDLQIPAGLDVALTADYGTDAACTGPGDPTEAAGWVQAWEKAGGTVSHVTVGNEEYGTWEVDLHAKPNDPGTYATSALAYYSDIKAVDKNVLVGVDVDADSVTGGSWDTTVLANAKGSYDFVEYHYYPEAPGSESDTYIVTQGANDLTNNINTLKQELKSAGSPNTPIYVGEIGGPYSNPGKQSWSITQGLYAGQVLGEMMNDGVSRLTWWIGFGNCNGQAGNDSASLYGWQNFGAYNVFSDGPADDPSCAESGPAGTMSPTAEAFNLMQNVLVNGENVLTPTVAGDTSDIRAYAATHSGGTALVVFNLNETTSEPVQITLSKENSSSGVTVITYDKSIYDQTNATPPVWAPPTTTKMGAQSLPLTLTLTPWSMNVILIQ